MRLCPRCTRPVALEVRLCRSCLDEARPLVRQSPTLSILVAVAEAEGRGLDTVAVLYRELRARDAAWKAREKADLADLVRRNAATWAARLLLEARSRGEKLTAREAGSRWNVRAGTVRQAVTRIRRHAEQEGATDPSVDAVRAASSGAR